MPLLHPPLLQVVLCNAGLNDALKYSCWSEATNAR